MFADNLSRVFYGFEPDFFQQNVSRIVDDVVSQFHASLEIWPTLVEICYLQKDKKYLPQIKVENKSLNLEMALEVAKYKVHTTLGETSFFILEIKTTEFASVTLLISFMVAFE